VVGVRSTVFCDKCCVGELADGWFLHAFWKSNLEVKSFQSGTSIPPMGLGISMD
jgi:hypothetical protein